MRRLDRYILGQLLSASAFFAFILVAVYWINRALEIFNELAAYGQSSWVYLRLSLLTVPAVLDMVLPIACFAATVFVVNRLSNDRELVMLRSLGFSPFRMARPYWVFALVMTGLSLVLSNAFTPSSKWYFEQQSHDIRQNVSTKILRAGRFIHPAPDVTFFIEKMSDEGELQSIFLSDASDADQLTFYTANNAYFLMVDDVAQLVMTDGAVQNFDNVTQQLSVTRFSELSYDLSHILNVDQAWLPSFDTQHTAILAQDIDVAAKVFRTSSQSVFNEIIKRLSMPLLCIAATLIGYSALLLGNFSRFGIWRQILFAFVLLVVVKSVEGAVVPKVRSQVDLWYLAYMPMMTGVTIAYFILMLVDHRGRFFKRNPS